MPSAAFDTLTDSQRDTLRLVTRGFTSKEIARQLGIAEDTVDQRITAARTKLGASTRKEAARLFAEHEALCGRPVYPTTVIASADAQEDQPGLQSRIEQRGWGQVEEERTVFIGAPPRPSTSRLDRMLGHLGDVHDLSPVETIRHLAILIVGITFAAGVLLAGLASLTKLAVTLAG